MSNFRMKTNEVLEKGKKERGNFQPPGLLVGMYNYWLNASESDKAYEIRSGKRRENLCHFGRIILFWAPMFWISNKANRFVSNPFGATISVAIALALAVWACMVSGAVLSVVMIALLSAVLIAEAAGVGYVAYRAHQRFWNSDWNHWAEKIGLGFLFAVLASILISLFVIATMAHWWAPFAILAGFACFAGLIALMVYVETYIRGKRALARELTRAKIAAMSNEEYQTYLNQKNEPSKANKFFSGLGDILIFVFQFARVKKWKICPFVEIK
jgi:hypothetical protein